MKTKRSCLRKSIPGVKNIFHSLSKYYKILTPYWMRSCSATHPESNQKLVKTHCARSVSIELGKQCFCFVQWEVQTIVFHSLDKLFKVEWLTTVIIVNSESPAIKNSYTFQVLYIMSGMIGIEVVQFVNGKEYLWQWHIDANTQWCTLCNVSILDGWMNLGDRSEGFLNK